MRRAEYFSISLLAFSLAIAVFMFYYYQSLMGNELGLAIIASKIMSLVISGQGSTQTGFSPMSGGITEQKVVLFSFITAIGFSIVSLVASVGNRIMYGWYKLYAGIVSYAIVQIVCISLIVYKYEIWQVI